MAAKNSETLRQPEPEVLLMGFGDSAWNMRLRLWIADPKRDMAMRSAINCAIVEKFRAQNIDIPFPQRVLHLRHEPQPALGRQPESSQT